MTTEQRPKRLTEACSVPAAADDDSEFPAVFPHRRFPCGDDGATGACPWRRDAAPGEFGASRFAELRETSVQPDGWDADAVYRSATGQIRMFACHSGAPGDDGTDVACAGWIGSGAAYNHLRFRRIAARGLVSPDVLHPGPHWPELFTDYDEMARVQGDPDR